MIDKKMLGRNVRLLREEKGLRITKLAGFVDTSDNQLSRIESGNLAPTLNVAINIANYFGIGLHELLYVDLAHSPNKSNPVNNLSTMLNKLDRHDLKFLYSTILLLKAHEVAK